MNDRSRLRACLCGVREQYDSEVQAGILQCVKSKSPHVPAMVIEMSSSLDSEPSSSPVQEQVTPSQLTLDTPGKQKLETRRTNDLAGAIVNGQCMCACEAAKNGKPSSFLQKTTVKEEDIPEEVIETESVSKKDEEPPKKNIVRFKEVRILKPLIALQSEI